MYIHCNYPGCMLPIANSTLCIDCFRKVTRYELELDIWLDKNYPSLTLEDVFGWYTYCQRDICIQDCLDIYKIGGCDCCIHNQFLCYDKEKIENLTFPSSFWIIKNVLTVENLC